MTMQQYTRNSDLQGQVWVRQHVQLNLPQTDERYFDKLAAFGLACFAAAIVGKLMMTALTPKQPAKRTLKTG